MKSHLADILPLAGRDSKAGEIVGREMSYRYRREQESMLAESHDLRNPEVIFGWRNELAKEEQQ